MGLSSLLLACVSYAPSDPAVESGSQKKLQTPPHLGSRNQVVVAQDPRGVTWILTEDSYPEATFYTLFKQETNRPPRRVAGPDSSFYGMLEAKIPDRNTARNLAIQELQQVIAESGRKTVQGIILQKSAMYAIQRDTYMALGFALPKDFGVLANNQDHR